MDSGKVKKSSASPYVMTDALSFNLLLGQLGQQPQNTASPSNMYKYSTIYTSYNFTRSCKKLINAQLHNCKMIIILASLPMLYQSLQNQALKGISWLRGFNLRNSGGEPETFNLILRLIPDIFPLFSHAKERNYLGRCFYICIEKICAGPSWLRASEQQVNT